MDNVSTDYLTKVQLVNTKTNEVFYDKLTYYYIEMPKFKKNDKELSNHLDYWLYTLNNMNSLNTIPQTLKEDKLINQAFNVAEFIAMDKDEQFAYQRDLKARLDYKNAMDYAIECATEKGKKEGKKEGIEKGKLQEKLEIAKNSISQGLDNQTISLITNLDIKTIQSLRN